jgi:predicted transcriptional regulator
MLINCAISEEGLAETACRLLSIIKQRHPSAFNEAADAIGEEDENVKGSVDQLIISLSAVGYRTIYEFILSRLFCGIRFRRQVHLEKAMLT